MKNNFVKGYTNLCLTSQSSLKYFFYDISHSLITFNPNIYTETRRRES